MTLNIWLQSPGLCGQESPREHNFRKYYLLLVCLFAAVANFEKLECSSPKDPCIAPISRTIISFFLIIKPSKIKTSSYWRRDQNIFHCNQASAGLRRGNVALFVQRGQSQVSYKTSPVFPSVYFLRSFNFCSFLSSPSRRV